MVLPLLSPDDSFGVIAPTVFFDPFAIRSPLEVIVACCWSHGLRSVTCFTASTSVSREPVFHARLSPFTIYSY